MCSHAMYPIPKKGEGLNPFFVRACVRITSVSKMSMSLSLNPFFVRACVRIILVTDVDSENSLNPFFVRACVRIYNQDKGFWYLKS